MYHIFMYKYSFSLENKKENAVLKNFYPNFRLSTMDCRFKHFNKIITINKMTYLEN